MSIDVLRLALDASLRGACEAGSLLSPLHRRYKR